MTLLPLKNIEGKSILTHSLLPSPPPPLLKGSILIKYIEEAHREKEAYRGREGRKHIDGEKHTEGGKHIEEGKHTEGRKYTEGRKVEVE